MNIARHLSVCLLGAAFTLALGAAPGWAADETAAAPVTPAPGTEIAADTETAGTAPPPAATDAPPTAEADKGGFSLRIGGSEDDPRGLVISVDGKHDEESARVRIAGRIADRIADELEQALADLPEEVRREIDAKDLEELRAAVRELEAVREGREPPRRERARDDHWAELIPAVAAIVLLFGGPVLVVAIVSANNRRKREMVHQTIDRVIEQGRDVPVELLDALDKGKNSGKTTLSRGMTNVALGVGIGVALFALAGADVAALGLIPLCIGVAQLAVWNIERRQSAGTPGA